MLNIKAGIQALSCIVNLGGQYYAEGGLSLQISQWLTVHQDLH